MTMFRQLSLASAAALALLALTACGEQQPADAPPAEATPPASAPPPSTPVPAPTGKTALSLDPGGLMVVIVDTGSTRMLDFGLPKAQTLDIVTRVAGAPSPETTNSECGAGPMQFVEYPGGLTLLFQDDRFAGWSADRHSAGKQSTMNGVGVGSTRSQLVAAYAGANIEETTLGQEFNAGGLSGILSGTGADAKVETLWAGASCVFR
ncbi:MAG: hypothetical protein KA105_06760 [Caulobacter sp.]|nr:hypothetical protein [Caulobacter sp.]